MMTICVTVLMMISICVTIQQTKKQVQLGAEREIPGDQRKAATGRQKVDFKKNNSDGVDVDDYDGDGDDDGDDDRHY